MKRLTLAALALTAATPAKADMGAMFAGATFCFPVESHIVPNHDTTAVNYGERLRRAAAWSAYRKQVLGGAMEPVEPPERFVEDPETNLWREKSLMEVEASQPHCATLSR